MMGVTRTGKSPFINLVSDRKAQIGYGLTSCTSDSDAFAIRLPDGRRAFIIDTPGFDHTQQSEGAALKSITRCPSNLYRKGCNIAAVMYIHRITDNYTDRSSVRDLELLRRICGYAALPRTLFVSTMWDKVVADRYKPDSEYQACERCEWDLLTDSRFLKNFMGRGSYLVRYLGFRDWPQRVLENLSLAAPNSLTLQLQAELSQGKSLSQTKAGILMNGELEAGIDETGG